MYNWTDEQLKAIETQGVPMIVSAAAGSGKTAVLVERTIRLLCDEKLGIPADTLLAVTFTNDAAAQMSRKLSAEIDFRAENEPDNLWIQRQQSLLRLAEITTINSFCYNLVKDNISDTDFQSGVRILEENEASMLCDRALTAVLEREYSENPEGTEELISLFCRENDAALRRMILQLYGFLRSLPFPKLWAKNVVCSLRDGSAAKEVYDSLDKKAGEIILLIETAINRLSGCAEGLLYHSAAKAVLLENCETAAALVNKSSKLRAGEISELARQIKWRSLTVKQTKAEKENQSEIEAGLYEAAKGCYSHLKDLTAELGEVCYSTEEEIAADAEKNALYFEKLVRLCELLDAEVHAMKVERNAVDFADTELISVRLLVECDDNGVLKRTPLCEEIVKSKRYKVILIDEFQDVNNLQEVIFKAISDTEDLSEIGSNVFVVGDVKQAIYRFRQANPKIFMKTRLQGRSEDSRVGEFLLRKNFRSRPAILEFCNYIFGALMSRRVGETDYDESEALVPGADYKTPDAPPEIIVINDSDSGEDVSTLEFTAAARTVRRLIDEKTPVLDGGDFRPCRPSDFCILTRSNVQGSEITDIFAEEGLKVLSNDTSGYLRSREISVLLNLLAVITDPMQDIPAASVLLSPIIGMTDDEIASLKLLSPGDRLYKIMLAVSKGEYEAGESLRRKSADAVELFKRLSVYASGLTLTRLIRKIYDETDIFSIASSYEDGDRKCANLYLLLEYAAEYEKSSPDGPAGFLRYIDYISKSGGDFEQALSVTESSDAVNIKTIHRSKGLEYPFVILCQTRKRFNQTDLRGPLLLNSEKGVGLSFLDYGTLTKRPTAFWKYIREINLSELLSEEMRLLYVAMTRAKERLFIVMDLSDRAVKRACELSYEIGGYRLPPAAVEKAVCPADWLFMALMKHKKFAALRSKIYPEPYSDPEETLPPLSVSPLPPSSENACVSEEAPKSADPGLIGRILESFSLEYDERMTKNEAKLTVSEIVHDDALSFFPRVPDLGESLEEISAAKRGTITHRFMQFCDFDRASACLEDEISRLKAGNIFSAREADAIDRTSVKKFFDSEIYSRLKKSGSVLREQRFIVRFDDIDAGEALRETYKGTEGMLQGVADCLFEEPDGYVLIDYKTDRVKSAQDLAERYSEQLALYKAAFDRLLPKKVKSSYIYSFRLGEGIELKL